MTIALQLKNQVTKLADIYALPAVKRICFPMRMSRDCAFLAIQLDDGSTGISYIPASVNIYSQQFQARIKEMEGNSPLELVDDFGSDQDELSMLALGAINSIHRFIMVKTDFYPKAENDPLAGLKLSSEDTLGMVGFFTPLIKQVQASGAQLLVVEQQDHSQLDNRFITVTTDPVRLERCNKIFITATTLINGSLEGLLVHCRHAEKVVVVGPTVGIFPDVLFDYGVDTVAGRYVSDGDEFIESLLFGHPWGKATVKTIFQRDENIVREPLFRDTGRKSDTIS